MAFTNIHDLRRYGQDYKAFYGELTDPKNYHKDPMAMLAAYVDPYMPSESMRQAGRVYFAHFKNCADLMQGLRVLSIELSDMSKLTVSPVDACAMFQKVFEEIYPTLGLPEFTLAAYNEIHRNAQAWGAFAFSMMPDKVQSILSQNLRGQITR